MTKYTRQKHKYHDPILPLHNDIYQNQCQTEVTIKQKNIDKLIFVESDEEEPDKAPLSQLQPPSSSRQQHRNRDLSLNRRRQLNNSFKPASTILRPSLMNTASDYEDEYNSVPNCESAIVPGRNKKSLLSEKRSTMPIQNNNFFDELISERDRLRAQEIAMKSQVSKVQSRVEEKAKYKKKHKVKKEESKIETLHQKWVEKSENQQQQENIQIRKLDIANLCFEASDEEVNKPEEPKVQIEPESTSVKLGQLPVAKDEGNIESENDKHEQAIKAHYPEQIQELHVDITSTVLDRQIEHRSLYLQTFIRSKPTSQQLVSSMLSPIYPSTKQIFEVHLYSTFSQKQYFLWLSMSPEMQLLMKAKKSIRLNKSSFQILTYNKQSQQYMETAYLQSNLDRSKFNLVKYDRSNNKKRMLATLVNSMNINQSKLIVMYYPRVDQNNYPAIFYIEQNNTDLQQIYRDNEIKLVDFTMTTRLDMAKRLNMMSFYELRASQKSMEFKNQKGNINVVIGKRGSKRYKIIVGPGLTPIQIFSMLIVQVET